MFNNRKSILNILFLMAVFSITFYYIFHGQDMSQIINYIGQTDVRYWILAVICVIFFMGSESIIIYYMMHTIRQKICLGHCFLYSFVGFFFSCITPSATGGQPAQIYYMSKDKIPISVATLVLMIVTITYKMVLIGIGIIVLVIRPKEILYYLDSVLVICYFGLVLNIICVGLMILLVFHPTIARRILLTFVKTLNNIRLLKHPEPYYKKINHSMQQYKDVALYFRTHKLVMLNILAITIVQRLLLFFITYLTYRSFGLERINVVTVVVLQGMISVAVDMLPLPGGMGISEKLFLMIFTPIFGGLVLPAMVISRGLSYYTELIISAFLTIIAYFLIIKKTWRKTKNDRIL